MGGREQRERACWLLKADTQRRETEKRGDFEEELGFFDFFFLMEIEKKRGWERGITCKEEKETWRLKSRQQTWRRGEDSRDGCCSDLHLEKTEWNGVGHITEPDWFSEIFCSERKGTLEEAFDRMPQGEVRQLQKEETALGERNGESLHMLEGGTTVDTVI
jgi:hypothetical protein